MTDFQWPLSSDVQGIFFHVEAGDLPQIDCDKAITWLMRVIEQEHKAPGEINFIFCDDAMLLEINIQFLRHRTLTDIITFPHEGPALSGDIYISTERVADNAKKFKVTFEEELHRVMVHGILHLCGYTDKSTAEKAAMRTLEDQYLRQIPSN